VIAKKRAIATVEETLVSSEKPNDANIGHSAPDDTEKASPIPLTSVGYCSSVTRNKIANVIEVATLRQSELMYWTQ